MSEEKKQFKSKRLTKKQLKELREQHPETLYPLVAYHYELYNMIEAATKEGRKISVKEICERMPDYYYLNEKECNYSNCPNLYKDIDYLNHAKFRKIICKDNGGFFLANEDEAKVYEEKLLTEAKKAFAEYWTIHRKIEMNGQGVFIDADGKVIDEKSKAKQFIESFVTTAVKDAFAPVNVPYSEDESDEARPNED